MFGRIQENPSHPFFYYNLFKGIHFLFSFCEQPLHAGQSLGRHRQGHWSIPGVCPVLLVIRPTRQGSKKSSGCHPQSPRRLPPTTSDRRRSCGVWIPGVLETILKELENCLLNWHIYDERYIVNVVQFDDSKEIVSIVNYPFPGHRVIIYAYKVDIFLKNQSKICTLSFRSCELKICCIV